MAIIATKGALDMAYPQFILGSTAAALGAATFMGFAGDTDICLYRLRQ
jgi:peroxiredoxin family protein